MSGFNGKTEAYVQRCISSFVPSAVRSSDASVSTVSVVQDDQVYSQNSSTQKAHIQEIKSTFQVGVFAFYSQTNDV